jgi:nitrous oxidase accessory protein
MPTPGRAARGRGPAPSRTFPLYQRDKRVHGLKPFQALVDAAPEGSVLRRRRAATPGRWC